MPLENYLNDIFESILETHFSNAPGMALSSLPGWDSMAFVKLVVKIEANLNRELSEAEIESLVTTDDVQKMISSNA